MNQLNGLYPIRFIAAVAVVYYHFWPGERKGISAMFLENANEAVNIFFFISGLVLAYANADKILNKKITSFQFLMNRVARLYPMYLLSLVMVIVFSLIYQIELGKTTYYKLPFELIGIQNWLYPGSINFPAWSLSVELFFYVTFPFVIAKFYNKIESNFKAVVLGILVYFIVVAVLNLMTMFPEWFHLQSIANKTSVFNFIKGYIEYNPFLRYGYFLSGICCYIAWRDHYFESIFRTYHSTIFISSLVGIAALYYLISLEMDGLMRSGALVIFYFSLFLSLTYLKDSVHKILGHPILLFLGNVSYGIYILQYPIQLFYTSQFGPIDTALQYNLYFLILFITSALLYRFYEDPLNHYLRKKFIKTEK